MRFRLAVAPLLALALSAPAVVLVQASPAARPPAQAPAAPAAAQAANGAWTTYHHDNAHTGYDPSAPTAHGGVTGWVTGTMDHSVYAEPLIYNGVVYAATLGNTVYAFDQATGMTLWHTTLRAPETGIPPPNGNGHPWACGNVAPQGILGTPVIDGAGGRIYVATFGLDDIYRLEALNLATGTTIWANPPVITAPAAGFDWTIEQQRGALALANGYVYVPFGGRAGDCGDYHGYVFAVPTDASAVTNYYQTPGSGAGFWAAGGVVVDDSTGKVFETSGNGVASGCDQGTIQPGHLSGVPTYENDALVRFSATLAHEDAFIPDDWHNNWCINDQDLGSATPVLISSTLAFQSGKWGSGFLVNPQALGGLDGQLYPGRTPYNEVNVCAGLNNDANFGSYAYAAPNVYMGCEGHGLMALAVNSATPSFSKAWNATGFQPGPPIVAGGAVWAVDTNGGGLYGFDASTGTQIYHSGSFGVTHFTTPSEAGGHVYVGSGNVVRSFDMLVGCSSSTLAASPSTSAPTGATVLLTASASGSNCTTPNFRFWIRPPGANWGIVQDYSAMSTYSWTSTGVAGVYGLEVDVRQAGSTAAYESVANLTYTLNPCTAAGLTAMPASPQAPGPTVILTGSASCPDTATYRFWTGQNGIWTMVQDYSTTNTYNWNTSGLALGTYGLEVDVRNQHATAAYEKVANLTYSLAIGPCTTPGLVASPMSSAPTGSSPTFTASTSGCPTPNYRFWVGQNGIWTIKQDYSASNTFTWSTASYAAGTYGIEVDVRNQGSSVAYDQVANITYTLGGCTAAGLSANPPSPHLPGGTITLTGTASCPGTATYRFWIGQSGIWTMAQDYSTTNTFAWNTTGIPVGSAYGLEVDVRNQGAGAAYEKVANITYLLAAAPCNTPSLSGNPSGSAASGSTPVFTASTSGCPTPNYRFWIGQNGIWHILQDYSATSTFSWNTTGYAAATYGVEVDVRDASSSVAYDHVANLTYTLVGCSAAHLSTDKSSPQVPGTSIVLTGSASCPGTPQYRFWTGQNGIWTIAQDFGPTNTFSWNTTGLAHGSYGLEVDVRDQGSGSAYETVANLTYTLSACTAANLGASPPGSAARGTTVVLTATATCPGTPTYRFLVNGAVVQDYSTTNTFSWSTTGKAAATYQLEVDVRDQGAGGYEVWSITSYSLT